MFVDEFAIDGRRVFIRFRCAGVVSSPLVDVRRHVNEVTRCGGERIETVGRFEGAFRMGRCLDGVNVVMVGAEVLGIALQHGLEDCDDVLRLRRRFPLMRPEFPGTQIHHALGVQRLDVEIVRIFFRKFTHCLTVVGGELLQIGARIV